MNCLRLLPITLIVGLALPAVLRVEAQDNPIIETNIGPELQFTGNEPVTTAETDANRQTMALPRPPTGLSATTYGDHAVRLSWTPDPAGQREYEIERSLSGFGYPGTWETSSRIGGGVTSCVDPDRIPGAIRSYRVRAWNPNGYSAYSEIVTANTPSPCQEIVLAFGYAPEMPAQELTNITALAVGSYHALALRADGTVVGWGYDGEGNATPPTNLNHVTAIATKYYHSLALRSDGTVVGWGADWDGQVSGATSVTNIKAIAAGRNHSLALKNDGTVVGWGYDGEGSATPPTNLTGVVAIAAGGAHSLALKSDGTVVGWGADWDGQSTPPTNLTGVVAIAAGEVHSLALKNDGTVVGWGADWDKQSTPPTNLTGVVAISAGYYHSMALRNNGEVVAWGYWFGDPDVFAGLSGRSTAISAGYDFSLILTYAVSPPEFGNYILQAANRVQISWTDRSANEYGFRIQRRPGEDQNPPVGWTDLGTVPANITNFTDTTTVSNGFYLYRVQALNPGCGDSPFSPYMYVTVVPPGAPYYPWTAVGETNVSVTWYLDYAADGYRVQRAPDVNGQPGDWTQLAVIARSALPPETGTGIYTETNVVIGASYWYRVQAFNAVGDSPFSPSARLDVLPPSVPTLYVSAFADQALLQWYYSAGGTKIERAPDGGGAPGSWQEIAVLLAGNEGRYSDPGHALNTISWYRVRAFNFAGNSPYSDARPVVTLPPRAPYSLYARMGVSNGVDLNWNVERGDSDGFHIERAPDVAGVPGVWAPVGTMTNSNSNTYLFYTDRPVQPFRKYWYRVRGFNALGQSAFSPPAQVYVTLPPVPEALSATTFADRIDLSWYVNDVVIPEGYHIQRTVSVAGQPGIWTNIATLNADYYSYGYYSDTGRVANVTYWYRVRAFNWAGLGPFCVPISARLALPAAPQGLNATLGNTNQAIVTWYAGYPTDQDGIKLERAPDISGNPGTWQQIATIFATNYYYGDFSDTNVQANAGYWYRARSFNLVGHSAYSDRFLLRVQPPATPELYSIYATRDTITIYWSSYYNNGLVAGHQIERAPNVAGQPGAWSFVALTQPDAYSYTDSELSSGTTYWYRVRTFGWTGTSGYSTPLNATIAGPSAPNSVFARLSTTNNAAVVSWYHGSGDADGFRIERAPNAGNQPGAWTGLATVFGTNFYYLNLTDTNVVAFSTNWYRVSSFNEIGISTNSAPFQLRVVPPLAPVSLFASPFRDTIRLSWNHPDAVNSAVLGFKIQRAPNLSGVPGAWTTIATNLTEPNYYYSFSFTDTGRAANNRYWYRVLAFNWVGDSPVSSQVSALIVPPATPTFLSATLGQTNGVLLSSYSSVGDQNGFQFEVAPNVGNGPGTWRLLATVPNTNSYFNATFTDTNALPFTTNWYRVRAFSGLGVSTYTTAIRIALTPPGTPAGLNAYESSGQISLYWNSSSGFVQGYKIERAPDVAGAPGAWVQISKSAYGYTSHADLAVLPGSTYWYRVRAYSWVGDSAYSTPVRVGYSINGEPLVERPPLETGPITLAVAVEGNDILLTWQAFGGTTNFVQATEHLAEEFVDRTGPIVIPGEGPVTMVYRDIEAAANADRRFYRIRIQP